MIHIRRFIFYRNITQCDILSYSISVTVNSWLESQIPMVIQIHTYIKLSLTPTCQQLNHPFCISSTCFQYGIQILRQRTALFPKFLTTCNSFSIWRASGKILAVEHCLFLSVQCLVGEQQTFIKSSTLGSASGWLEMYFGLKTQEKILMYEVSLLNFLVL